MTASPPTPPTRPDDPAGDSPCSLITRRRFITGLGASMVVAACSGSTVSVFTSTTAGPSGPVAPGTFGSPIDRVLVVIELGGGNDGLNMVVPHADARYHDLRQSVALADPIDLDGEIGFHPALTALAARYEQGQVAIVEGVGVPDPDLSHFVSMETWWTAMTDDPDATGWLGRYLDGTVGMDDPLAGIAIGPGPSRALLGAGSFAVAIADDTGLTPRMPNWIDSVDDLMGAWRGFAAEDPARIELRPVQRAIAATVDARKALQTALEGGAQANGRRRDLVSQLDLAARLVISDVAPTVIYVHGVGDFDTHEAQLARHGQLMTALDGAIDGFFTTLEAAGAADRAVVLTASEFGRRPRDNGGGTDHGTAAPHMLIGPGVRGGRHGDTPSLAHLDSTGNLVHTVDFRSVYATVLDEWLGADADSVLGATYERLAVFR